MVASGSQNQLQSSLAPLRDLLKALMFLSNLNGFNFSPLPLVQRFNQRKGSSKVWKEKSFKWFYHFPPYFLVFVYLFFNFIYFFFDIKIWKIKKIKKKIQKQCVFVYIGTCVLWMAIETKFSKICISCSLDEHLYAQLSKWALWLMFVMSKIK